MYSLLVFSLLLSPSAYASQATIYLYDQPNCASVVGGDLCSNIADGTCCYKQNKFWNSTKVVSQLGYTEWIEPFSLQTDDYCGVELADAGPGCYDDDQMLRLNGAMWWENPEQGGIGRRDTKRNTTSVEADMIFLIVDGVEYHLDSDSKEGREYRTLTSERAKEAYMKEHSTWRQPY